MSEKISGFPVNVLKIATKSMKDVMITDDYSYPKGAFTEVWYKDQWSFEPINWDTK